MIKEVKITYQMMISRISQAKQALSKISEDNFLIVVDEFGNEYPIECITRHNTCSDDPYNFCYAFKIYSANMGCLRRGGESK